MGQPPTDYIFFLKYTYFAAEDFQVTNENILL